MARIDKKAFADAITDKAKELEIQQKIESSFSNYLNEVKNLGKLKEQLNHLDLSSIETLEQIKSLEADIQNDKDNGVPKSDKDLKKKKDTLAVLKNTKKEQAKQLIDLNSAIKSQAVALNQAKKLQSAYNSAVEAFAKLPGLAANFVNTIRNLDAVDMSREIKKAQLSMGVLSSQSASFSKTFSNASKQTNIIGVGVSELAKYQAEYSEGIGRAIQLSEQELISISEMGKGTGIGVSNMNEMVVSLDKFGVGINKARDINEDIMNSASKMGVNSTLAVKNLTKNLSLAQKFNFKAGVKGMADMALSASKVNVDVNSFASAAEKSFRIEGAVEMAAQLQTMGGEFAKLGDPFALMFKARNDFGGFVKDIMKASGELSTFNAESGAFEISGMQLDRIRELSQMLGISVEELSNMGREQEKFNQIKSITPSAFDDEDKELISSLGKYNADTHEWVVRLDGKDTLIKDLNVDRVKMLKNEQMTLKQRAIEAQTFDDAFTNLVNNFKTTLLPFVDSLNKYLVQPIADLQNRFDKEGYFDKMKDLAKIAGDIIGSIGKFIVEFPKISVGIYLGVKALFGVAQWIANGISLAKGFNMYASAGGTGGGGGAYGVKGGQIGPAPKMSFADKAMGKNVLGGKLAMGTMGSVGAGVGLGLAGMGLDYGRSKMDNPESGGGKALGVLSSAAKGAGMGVMFGPWGAAIGGVLGAAYGAYDEFIAKGEAANESVSTKMNVDDAVIKFNDNDKFANIDNHLIASTDKGKIDNIVKTSKEKTVIEHLISFGNFNINGNIKINSNGGMQSIDLSKDPFFIKEITKLIQEEIRMNIGGGKLSPAKIN